MALRVKVVGYSGTCLEFAAELLKTFKECSEPGAFSKDMLENVIQEKQ